MQTVYDIFPKIDDLRNPKNYADIRSPFFWEVFEKCKASSLLGVEGFYNLFRSIEYIARNQIPGDIVECGVFLGGAILAMSEFAQHFGLRDRRFHLYDTFAGFPSNTKETDLHGKTKEFCPHKNFLSQVQALLSRSPFPADQFKFVPGLVEETLAVTKPEKIALLRLDTDYYESTRVELEALYPQLASGGVLIVDDYGHFEGARRATDEYFAKQARSILFSRINYSVRCGVKIS